MTAQVEDHREVPFGSPRRYAVLKRIAYQALRLFYRIRVVGTEHVPRRGPLVVASNHPSYLDPPILFLAFPREVRFMAWDRLFAHPRFSSFFHLVGAIPVDLAWSAPSTIKAARRVLEAQEVLGMFPEGHRTRSERLDPFKRGVANLAATTRSRIVPVSISGARRIWGFGRSLPRFTGRILVRIHPPFDPPERGDGAEQAWLERLREVIESGI